MADCVTSLEEEKMILKLYLARAKRTQRSQQKNCVVDNYYDPGCSQFDEKDRYKCMIYSKFS